MPKALISGRAAHRKSRAWAYPELALINVSSSWQSAGTPRDAPTLSMFCTHRAWDIEGFG